MSQEALHAWKQQAIDVCDSISRNSPVGAKQEVASTLLGSLSHLSKIQGCPYLYKLQVRAIRTSLTWDQAAKTTHLYLAEIADENGKNSDLYVNARSCYDPLVLAVPR